MRFFKFKVFAVVAMAALAISGCAGGSDTDSAKGEVLRVGTDAEPTTLDAQKQDDNGLTLATWSINEGLVDFDRDGKLVPVLAAELPQTDPQDRRRWTIKLRDGIEFTDGTPFDAEAVKFNIERFIDPAFKSPLAGNLTTIAKIEVADPHTVVIVTKEPDAILPNRLRQLRIVSPKAAQAGGYDGHPVGTGPYVFDSWQKGTNLVLKENTAYWGETKPSIPRVEIRFIPDENTRLSALEAGELDIAINPPINRLDALTADGRFKVHETKGGESGITFIPGHMEPYSDVRFRQAMNFAVNRQEMIDKLFDGRFTLQSCNVVSEGTEGYTPELEGTYDYDPGKARQLLSEVDIPKGFKLKLMQTVEAYSSGREIAETLASYWEAVGIPVKVEFVDIGKYLEVLFDPKREVVLYGESSKETNTMMREVDAYYTEGEPGNSIDAESQRLLNPLIAKANQAFEPAERAPAIAALAETVCERALQLFTFHRLDLTAMASNLEYDSGFGGFTRTDFHHMRFTD
jgi:peptide/nickel transport system substrate-binding protein